MTDQHTKPSTFDHVAASRFVTSVRDAFVASGANVGPTFTGIDGSTATAFRADNDRVRFEVVETNGDFAEFTFQGAARHFAAKRAAAFA